MSVTCTIEARLNSSRLPGKSLYCLNEQPVIIYSILAALNSQVVDRVILCTTERAEDDLLEKFSEREGIECFRGSENNVAGRIAAALSPTSGTNIFLTADNPFVSSDLIADCFSQFKQNNSDYLCTTHMKYCDWWELPPVLPTGLSVQIAKSEFFLQAERACSDNDPIREHSTMVMYKTKFVDRIYSPYQMSKAPDVECNFEKRYTVDTPEDFMEAERLMSNCKTLTLAEILQAGNS